MWPRNDLIERLGTRHPIIQAPMAAVSTVEMAVAVSKAGGLGSIAGAHLSGEELKEAIRAFRLQTDLPFNVNLYIKQPTPAYDERRVSCLKSGLDDAHRQLNAGPAPEPQLLFQGFEEKLEVVLDERVPILSTHFGMPSAGQMKTLNERAVCVMATATTVEEALILQRGGIEAIIAQGAEAGGHRGTFASKPEEAAIGTMVLVPQIADHVRVPVIAAGGIMDARGVAAAFALGAAGVQMGTAFIPCHESGAPQAYRRHVITARSGETVLTDAVSGRAARLIGNRLVDLLERHRSNRLGFPLQLSMGRNLTRAAKQQGRADFTLMWAGQGAPLAREASARSIVTEIVSQARQLLADQKAAA